MQMARGERCKKCGTALGAGPVRPAPLAPAPPPPPAPDDVNPYAPPTVPAGGGVGEGSEGLWRDGKILVASREAAFPDRCVKCNAPAGGYRLKRLLRWHEPAWYLLILINILIYAIVATFIQKKAALHIGLCDRHRKRRLTLMGVGVSLPLLAMGGCAIATDPTQLMGLALLAIFVGLVMIILASQVVTPKHIDDRFVHIKGVSPEFLASLPTLDQSWSY